MFTLFVINSLINKPETFGFKLTDHDTHKAGDWGVITLDREDDQSDWVDWGVKMREKLPRQFVGQLQVINNSGHGTIYWVWCPDQQLSCPINPSEFKGAFER